MGLEAVFFLGALVLLTALIYGVLSYRYRNRALDRVAEDVTRERYRKNETWCDAVGLVDVTTPTRYVFPFAISISAMPRSGFFLRLR
jgi:hypothetical protein